jgi:hypothetical protein
MKPRTLAAGALVLGAATLGWWSCSGDERAGGAEQGDGGAAAGSGAGGGSSGAGAAPSGGASGGTATGGSDWGAKPRWEATDQVAAGCPIERLVNASELRILAWQPCSWSPEDCEEAVFNPWLVGTVVKFYPTSTVNDDGTQVRVGVVFDMLRTALYGTEAGGGLEGLRTSGPDCLVWTANVWSDRFGAMVAPRATTEWGADAYGGVVGRLGSFPQPVVGFTVPKKASLAPGPYVLGADRWLWEWGPLQSYTTVSAVDGSDYTLLATTAPPSPFVDLGHVVTTGKRFLFPAFVGDDAGLAHGKIFHSDGIAEPEVYLEPTEPDTYYGSPIYTHSHVAFFKGIQFHGINTYGAVELWTSPYSDNPSELKPAKLADLAHKYMPITPAGGWGSAAFGGTSLQEAFVVWDLGKGTQRAYARPEGFDKMNLLGVTRAHIYMGATKTGSGGALVSLFRNRLE